MGGSAPGRAVLLFLMLRETATNLLWICASPRRKDLLLLLCVHTPHFPLLLYSLQWEGLRLVEPFRCLLG